MKNSNITKCSAVLATLLAVGGIALTAVPAHATTAVPVTSTVAASAPAAPFVASIEFDPRQTFTMISGRSEPNAGITVAIGGRTYQNRADQYGAWVLRDVAGLTGSTATGTASQTTGGQVSPVATFTLRAHGDEALVSPSVTTSTFSLGGQFTTVSGTALPGAIVGVVVDGKRYATTASTDGGFSVTNVVTPTAASASGDVIQYLDGRNSDRVPFTLRASSPVAPAPAVTPVVSPVVTPVVFTNPANPAAGYVPNTAFTFRGTASPGAKITLQNAYGTIIATGITTAADGTWSWTRANMATSIWKITAIADAGTPTEQSTTLGAFAPQS